MRNRIVWNGNVIWQEGLTPNVWMDPDSERDINAREHAIEGLGDRYSNLYRGVTAQDRVYSARFVLQAGMGYSLKEVMARWEAWHSVALGQCVLTRYTESGGVYYLSAAAETPRWGDRGPRHIDVEQAYIAATPFWYGVAVSEADNFAAAPVDIACTNAGDLPTWIALTIAGAVEDPLVAGADWEIEFDLDIAAGSTLAVNCKTPATAWLTIPPAAAIRAYGYRTQATTFRRAKLPVGASNVTISRTAGAGLCTVTWQPLYEALR